MNLSVGRWYAFPRGAWERVKKLTLSYFLIFIGFGCVVGAVRHCTVWDRRVFTFSK